MVGFNAKNKCVLDTKYICSTCSLIIREPMQLTTCGHRLCRSCVANEQETTIECRKCWQRTQRDQVWNDRGFQNDMGSLPIECTLCPWNANVRNYQNHLDQHHINLKCEYCFEQFDSMNKLTEHQVLRCQKNVTNCLLKAFGCDQQTPYCDLSNHYLTEKHQNSLRKACCQMKSQMHDVQNSSGSITTDRPYSHVRAVDIDTTALEELCHMSNIVLYDIKQSADDERRLNNGLLRYQIENPLRNLEFIKVQVGVQEMSPKKTDDQTAHMSDDGTFIWKIEDLWKKRMDAQSERQTSIYSPAFYSSPTGYKMCARLYLNGDGNARHTHMSIFLVLMRSGCDAILKFPFSYKVTFCLYDQTSAQKHIIDSFRPDIRSNSFQRPRSDMNIASGIPKLFPLATIQQENNPYVQDDAMFIKVMVDFGDMPKTVLPYALSLNPGLPTHIRQMMINQEAQRRAQQTSITTDEVQSSRDEVDR